MMELGVMLLCIVGCSLSRATPIKKQRDDIHKYPNNNKTILEIFKEVNKGLPVLLHDGDINRKHSRSVKQNTWKKSANGIVQIPFVLSSSYGTFDRSRFDIAMGEFKTMTCVQFVNRTTEKDYISLETGGGGGCWATVGKVGGKQTVAIDSPGCMLFALIQHELMHMLGFYHEHTRSDRDQYIDVFWQNISPNDFSNFNLDDGNTLNLPYDYSSILHFGGNSYSNTPGQPSMVAIFDPSTPLGSNPGLGNLDVMKVNTAYKCNLCRRKIVGQSGFFSFDSTLSPQGPFKCFYLVQTPDLVLLQITDLNVPISPDCNDAYIKVYDGVSNSSPVLLDKTCGNGLVPAMTSSGSFMLIEIVNNLPVAGSIFNAAYKKARFGGTYFTDNDYVTSPFFPNFYPSSVDIVYTIIAPIGYKVSLTIVFLRVEYAPTCSIEYLTVRDGPLLTSPILGTYCRFTDPALPLSVSTGNIMILQFHSANTYSHNGFYAAYEFVPLDVTPVYVDKPIRFRRPKF